MSNVIVGHLFSHTFTHLREGVLRVAEGCLGLPRVSERCWQGQASNTISASAAATSGVSVHSEEKLRLLLGEMSAMCLPLSNDKHVIQTREIEVMRTQNAIQSREWLSGIIFTYYHMVTTVQLAYQCFKMSNYVWSSVLEAKKK